jgi:hypothetical protein
MIVVVLVGRLVLNTRVSLFVLLLVDFVVVALRALSVAIVATATLLLLLRGSSRRRAEAVGRVAFAALAQQQVARDGRGVGHCQLRGRLGRWKGRHSVAVQAGQPRIGHPQGVVPPGPTVTALFFSLLLVLAMVSMAAGMVVRS